MKHIHLLSFVFAFGFFTLVTPQAYAQNITAATIPVVSATSLTITSIPMVNPVLVAEPVVPAITAVPTTQVEIQGVTNFPVTSVDLGNIPQVPHVPVSGLAPHSGSMNGAMLTPVDLGEIATPHTLPVQEPITPPSMVPIPPTTQEPVTGSSGSSSHHSSGGQVIGSTTHSSSHASSTSSGNISSGSTYKTATVVNTYAPEYNPNSTSNVRVAKLPLIAEEDMIDFDKIPHKSSLSASAQNVPVQIPLVGVLAAVALILMIAIAIRRNTIKKQQPQVVYA